MNNVFVYIEIEGTEVREVSQELLTKGRKLANELGVELHAVAIGTGIKGKVEEQVLPYGVDKMFVFDAPELFPYTSAPHTDIVVNLFKEEQPQICLMGATVIGRDLGPRVSSSLTSGLTADCTQLEIGPYEDKKSGKTYENLLYQIRPAFGGNIVATIVNPDHRPQMATVRSGVMQKAVYDGACKKEVVYPEVSKYVSPEAFVVKVLDHHVEAAKHNLKGAPIVVRPPDWPDGRHGAPQGVHRLRHQRPNPAHRRHAGFGHHHQHQLRPRGPHQQDCRLCDYRHGGRGCA